MERPALPRLWLAHVEGPWPDEAAAWLDAAETERLGRFIPAAERRRRLVAWSLRRWALSQTHSEIAPAAWRFTIGPYGKPEVAADLAVPGLHHSLSHGGDYAAVLIANCPCGVDVEAPPRGLEAMDVAFSPEERAVVIASTDPVMSFLQIWVAKETVLKLSGLGLTQAPQSVSLAISPDDLTARVSRVADLTASALEDARVRLWPLGDGHWLGASTGAGPVDCEPMIVPWQHPALLADKVQT